MSPDANDVLEGFIAFQYMLPVVQGLHPFTPTGTWSGQDRTVNRNDSWIIGEFSMEQGCFKLPTDGYLVECWHGTYHDNSGDKLRNEQNLVYYCIIKELKVCPAHLQV